MARDRGETVCDAGAAAEESQAALQASGGAREEQNGGAGRVKGRQILEGQSILEGSDHVQMYVSSVWFQAKRSATGRSQPPVSGVCLSYRWTARRGAPPCDLGSCWKYGIYHGIYHVVYITVYTNVIYQ
jgi:hypothetical protein